jgi:hypothetical protein
LIQERCRLPRERAIGYQSARNGVLEKTFSSLREKTPVEKDFPRSGVTPPPSLTQRGSQLEALGTRPHWLPPYGRFALRGCDPVSPLDPPDYGPPGGPRTEAEGPQVLPRGSLLGSYLAWEPFIFPLLGASRTAKNVFTSA